MTKDVDDYVKKYEKCQRNKTTRAKKMPMVLSRVSQKAFDKMYVDIVGPLPQSEGGNKYILSMVDDLTTFVDIAPMPHLEANTVALATILFEQIISRCTLTKIVLTDQGSQFTGEVFKNLCKLLKNYVDKKPATWDKYVQQYDKRVKRVCPVQLLFILTQKLQRRLNRSLLVSKAIYFQSHF